MLLDTLMIILLFLKCSKKEYLLSDRGGLGRTGVLPMKKLIKYQNGEITVIWNEQPMINDYEYD